MNLKTKSKIILSPMVPSRSGHHKFPCHTSTPSYFLTPERYASEDDTFENSMQRSFSDID